MSKKHKAKAPTAEIQNGLAEATLGLQTGFGTQVNQVDTIFKNNRWYMISNMRQVLSQMYVENGLVQTIVDVPVDDGMRGGLEIKSKQLSPEQIAELDAYLEKQDILGGVVGQALKWNRLFGGAGILILTDQDPITPLDMDLIDTDSKLAFRAVDMWELFYDKQTAEGSYSVDIGNTKQVEFYNFYGIKIHHSRVLKMKGLEAPSFIRPRMRGWGFSVVEALVESINQFLKSNNLVFEVLDEFKLDVFKFEGLNTTLMSQGGKTKIQTRVQTANQQKNFNKALVMDKNDDFQQKQVSFAGIAELKREFRIDIACNMRMPMSKIFGQSSTGFSSGEDDIENYNSMITSQVRDKSKFENVHIVGIICQKLFGFVPDDLSAKYKPLRILSAEQEENVKNSKFNRVLAAKTSGEITSKEFRDCCNKDNLLPVQLETEEEVDTL